MKIKAIIFDLDETLYDWRGISDSALKQAIKAMIDVGFKASLNEAFKTIKKIILKEPKADKFRDLAKEYNQEDESIIEAGYQKYINMDFESLDIYPDTKETLEKLKDKFRLILITQGSERQQNKKIDVLGIRGFFEFILIPTKGEKKKYFLDAIELLKLKPEEIMIVGDEIMTEIKIGNELGMKTVRLLKGKYKSLEAVDESEVANYEVNNLIEILDIVK